MKRIAALVPNALGVSPGQRVRIESWAPYLRDADWTVDFYPFEDDALREVLYAPAPKHIKARRLVSCYKNRLKLITHKPPCDVLFIFREAALFGPAIIERLALRWKVPIVYDIDDPVFLSYRSPMNGWFSLLKFPKKTHAILRMSDHVVVINNVLANYASKYNSSVSVIPNCVDTDHYRPAPRLDDGVIRLVWIGSHSTMPNLKTIVPVLRDLPKEPRVSLRVIGAGQVVMEGMDVEVRQWSADTEVSDLQNCDIGLLPLLDHAWHPWKFFFKTVQYMAVGLPVIARRLGSNSEIIEDGVNGFLVETQEEWRNRLQQLINDEHLRHRMGQAARSTIVQRYSTRVQMPRVVSIFESVLSHCPTTKGRVATAAV